MARQVRRVLLSDSERQALKSGTRTVIRREIRAGNSTVSSGKFSWLDVWSAHAKPYVPMMEIRARVDDGHARRSVTVSSVIRAGDVIVSALQNQAITRRISASYVVRKVGCQRVRSVTHEQAMTEGYIAAHYSQALEKLGPLQREQWEKGEQHREASIAPTSADVFALDWIATHQSFAAWRRNPWVWFYTLEIWEADPMTVIAALDRVRR